MIMESVRLESGTLLFCRILDNKIGFMRKTKLFMLCAALLAVSCSQEDVVLQGVEATNTDCQLVATLEGDNSRMQLNDECQTVWTAGDRVAVVYASGSVEEWKYEGETGARTGVLKPVAANSIAADEPKMTTIYPYANYAFDADNATFEASLPAEQNYLENSYGVGSNIMVGIVEGTTTTLKSVCGWLRLDLCGYGEVVRSIKFRGNNSEQVAGEIIVKRADATATFTSDAANALSEVTLNCGTSGVMLGAAATSFYISLPPQTFSNGFEVEVICDGELSFTKKSEQSVTISRNHITPMEAFDGELFYPDSKQVWYGTYSGDPLAVSGKPFDQSIVNNEMYQWCVNDSCRYVNRFTFNASVTAVAVQAFKGDDDLDTIYLPHSVTTIGAAAFSDCAEFYRAHLGRGVKSIEANAFSNCPWLSEVYCRATTPPALGEGVFSKSTNLNNIYVPAASVDAYKKAAGWSTFADKIKAYDFIAGSEIM